MSGSRSPEARYSEPARQNALGDHLLDARLQRAFAIGRKKKCLDRYRHAGQDNLVLGLAQSGIMPSGRKSSFRGNVL
jgi:hypothetical protein